MIKETAGQRLAERLRTILRTRELGELRLWLYHALQSYEVSAREKAGTFGGKLVNQIVQSRTHPPEQRIIDAEFTKFRLHHPDADEGNFVHWLASRYPSEKEWKQHRGILRDDFEVKCVVNVTPEMKMASALAARHIRLGGHPALPLEETPRKDVDFTS